MSRRRRLVAAAATHARGTRLDRPQLTGWDRWASKGCVSDARHAVEWEEVEMATALRAIDR